MGALFLAGLIVGLGMILAQLFLPGDGHDAGGELGDGHGGAAIVPDAHGAEVNHPLAFIWRLRFWTFACLGFGLLGSALYYLGLAPPTLTLIASIVVGLASGTLASLAFAKLSSEATNSGADTRDLVGQIGKVMVATNAAGTLKIRVRVRGQLSDYLAQSSDLLEPGSSVLVEEVRGDQLFVSAAPAEIKFTE